jgi:hypothetical protein
MNDLWFCKKNACICECIWVIIVTVHGTRIIIYAEINLLGRSVH